MGPDGREIADSIPEDVAALYAWAKLTGAKYRDYSAERRERRAQMRYRAAKELLQRELAAQAEAGAQGDEASRRIETARRAEDAARAALLAIAEEREIAEARASARRKREVFE